MQSSSAPGSQSEVDDQYRIGTALSTGHSDTYNSYRHSHLLWLQGLCNPIRLRNVTASSHAFTSRLACLPLLSAQSTLPVMTMLVKPEAAERRHCVCMQLNSVYPEVKIVMVQWPLEMLTAYEPGSASTTQGTSIIPPENYPVYQSFHQAAYSRAQAAGLDNVVYFEPPDTVGAFARGCAGHPSLQGHQALAEALTPFVAGIMGW